MRVSGDPSGVTPHYPLQGSHIDFPFTSHLCPHSCFLRSPLKRLAFQPIFPALLSGKPKLREQIPPSPALNATFLIHGSHYFQNIYVPNSSCTANTKLNRTRSLSLRNSISYGRIHTSTLGINVT